MRLFKIITPSDRTENKLEITRWVVKAELGEKTWDELIARLQKLFHTRSTQFFVSWFDGTDYCTIRDWQDLEEAAEFFAGSNSGNDTAVRIYVSPDKKEHQTIFGQKPPEDDDRSTISFPSMVHFSEDENLINDDISCDDHLQKVAELASEVSEYVKINDDVYDVHSDVEDPTTPTTVNAIPDQANPAVVPAYPYVQPNYGTPIVPTGNQPLYPVMMQQWPMQPMNQYNPADPAQQPNAQLVTQPGTSEVKYTPARPDAPPSIVPTFGIEEMEEEEKKQEHKTNEEKTHKEKKPKKAYVQLALDKLRHMGYTQDDKVLKRLIRSKKGNLNEIIDALNAE